MDDAAHNPELIEINSQWVRERLPRRSESSNKYSQGVVLIIAGSRFFPGAAVLSAMGALRAGAGLVCVAAVRPVRKAITAHLPEAIFLPIPERLYRLDQPTLSEHWVPHILAFLAQKSRSSIVVGPGLESSPNTNRFLNALLPVTQTPCVLDAEALRYIAAGGHLPTSPSVMTPHEGEMRHLLGTVNTTSRTDQITHCVRRYGRTVLLKGHETLISNVPGSIYVTKSGNSGMASGGMGDVLSGIIGTLLAQGVNPLEAAICGAFWHGKTGDRCLNRIGNGFTATDLAENLPIELKELNLG